MNAPAPLKTRYAILKPGPAIETDEPIDVSRLATLEWVDVEFKTDVPTLKELEAVLDPLFPGAYTERVAVNSFKGPADMFVDEMGGAAAGCKNLPVNQLATLIYWTASIMHELAASDAEFRIDPDPTELRVRALKVAADRLTVAPAHRRGPLSTTLAGLGGWAEVPQIHGRAVLFDDRVWL